MAEFPYTPEELQNIRYAELFNNNLIHTKLKELAKETANEEYMDVLIARDLFPLHLAINPNLPRRILEILLAKGYKTAEALASRKDLTREDQIKLLAYGREDINKTLAANNNIGVGTVYKLVQFFIEKFNGEVLSELAAHPNANKVVLDTLAKTHYLNVKLAIIENPRTSWDTLNDLFYNTPKIQQRQEKIQAAVASRPDAPEEIKEEFLKLQHERTLESVNYSKGKGSFPDIDYNNKQTSPVKEKYNQDLELLLKLKGYLKR